MAYAFVGLTILAAIFAWVALDAVDKSSDAILRERLNLATTVAQSIDQTITSSKSLVVRAAGDLATAHVKPGELSEHEVAMLGSLVESLADVNSGTPPEHVFLFDDSGNVLWDSRRSSSDGIPIPDPELFEESASPSVLVGDQGDLAITVGSSVAGNLDLAYLGAVILPSRGLLAVSDRTDLEFGEYRLELLDSNGRVVVDSSGESLNTDTRHMDVIGDLVSGRAEGVGRHAQTYDDEEGVDHIVAFTPLSTVPWGVVLEQSGDAALALPNSLRRRVLIIAAGGLVLGLAMAWITSRQVVLPLSRLTERAKKIAEGDLSGKLRKEIYQARLKGKDRTRSAGLPNRSKRCGAGWRRHSANWESGVRNSNEESSNVPNS
jgi:HAMP domain-containing protein